MTEHHDLSSTPDKNAPARAIPLERGYNLRDLGGCPTRDGRFVKCGKVYRSADLHGISPHDVRLLDRLDIKTVIDFRATRESEAAPNSLPASVVNVVALPVEPADILSLEQVAALPGDEMMVHVYSVIIREFQNVYTRFFEILGNAHASPLLFHCSAGKDRTGLAAAFLLSALDVSRDVIMEDYLMSAGPAKEKYRYEIEARPGLAPLFSVKKDYLDAAFHIIDSEYGGMDSYLTNRLHADIPLMRRLYTQSGPVREDEGFTA